MGIDVRWGAATHQGRVRKQNEDSVLAGPVLFAVADGMGGHAGGEVASATAIAMLAAVAESAVDRESLRSVLDEANREILRRARGGEGPQGMGTTVAGLGLSSGSTVTVFNLGDSRVYRFRDGVLGQLTEDDSLVAEMVRRGEISADEAATHRDRNVITRALGIEESIEPSVVTHDVEDGDQFIVCSDGLSNELSDDEIDRLLTAGETPEHLAQALLEAALATGGRDNISVVVVDVVGIGGGGDDLEADTNPHPPVPVETSAPAEPTEQRALITSVPPSAGTGDAR